MFNWFRREPERPNYGKIIAITLATVAAAAAIALVVYKLFTKYCHLAECDCEDFIDDGCEDCDICIEDETECCCCAEEVSK